MDRLHVPIKLFSLDSKTESQRSQYTFAAISWYGRPVHINHHRDIPFRSNSNPCLTGDLRQMPPGVLAYGIRSDPNLHRGGVLSRARYRGRLDAPVRLVQAGPQDRAPADGGRVRTGGFVVAPVQKEGRRQLICRRDGAGTADPRTRHGARAVRCGSEAPGRLKAHGR